MSQECAERLRSMIEAFSAGGIEAALPHFHPEIVWHSPPEWLEQAFYTGHEGLRDLAASWRQNFERYRLDVERVIDLGGNRALALLYQRGRIKLSGSQVEQAVAYVAELQDGKLVRVDAYFSWEAGLEAAGLSE